MKLDSALQESLDEVRRQADELRASRARIVEATDTERRRIERDLHDGAQQHLVALAVSVRLARQIADTDPEQAKAMLDQIGLDLQEAVQELRNLAHGIYPPLLMDRGLPDALRAAAGRAALPTSVEAEDIGRYPQQVEAAVYFCCLEALQNAGKHAGEGSDATVTLREDEGALLFDVADDGAGFDARERRAPRPRLREHERPRRRLRRQRHRRLRARPGHQDLRPHPPQRLTRVSGPIAGNGPAGPFLSERLWKVLGRRDDRGDFREPDTELDDWAPLPWSRLVEDNVEQRTELHLHIRCRLIEDEPSELYAVFQPLGVVRTQPWDEARGNARWESIAEHLRVDNSGEHEAVFVDVLALEIVGYDRVVHVVRAANFELSARSIRLVVDDVADEGVESFEVQVRSFQSSSVWA